MTVGRFYTILVSAQSADTAYTRVAHTGSDEYGIDLHQPLGVQHIMALLLYAQEPLYAQLFRDSYFIDARNREELMRKHCGNFYWFGRFLYEAIGMRSVRGGVCAL